MNPESNFINPDDEDIGAFVAGLLMGNDDVHTDPDPLHSMTFRIPLSLAAHIMAMANNADVSRNEMGRLLLQTGVDTVYSKILVPEIREDVLADAMERYQNLIEKN